MAITLHCNALVECLAHGFFCGPAGYPDGGERNRDIEDAVIVLCAALPGSLMMAFATLVTLSLPVLCCYTVELVVANVVTAVSLSSC